MTVELTLPPAQSMSQEPFRIGLLGAGYMAGNHGRNLLKLGESIVAVCDRDLERANSLAGELNGATAYADFQQMLDSAKLDALIVALPPAAHQGQVEAAASAGVNLFLEKPLALHVERGVSIVSAVQAAGVTAMMGYHMRFLPVVQKLKAMLEDGSAGKASLFQGAYRCNSLHVPWWRDVTKSGGQLLEQVIHVYDLALHLCGRPERVAALTENLLHREVEGYTVEDASASVFRCEAGALASITGSNAAVPGQWIARVELVAENVLAQFEDGGQYTLTHTNVEPPTVTTADDRGDPYASEIAAFCQAVRGEIPNPATVEDGLIGLKLARAALDSAASGGALRTLS